MGKKTIRPFPTLFAPAGEHAEAFNVCAELPPEDALELASMFLANAIIFAAEEAKNHVDYSAMYQMEMAKALINHAHVALKKPANAFLATEKSTPCGKQTQREGSHGLS